MPAEIAFSVRRSVSRSPSSVLREVTSTTSGYGGAP